MCTVYTFIKEQKKYLYNMIYRTVLQ